MHITIIIVITLMWIQDLDLSRFRIRIQIQNPSMDLESSDTGSVENIILVDCMRKQNLSNRIQ